LPTIPAEQVASVIPSHGAGHARYPNVDGERPLAAQSASIALCKDAAAATTRPPGSEVGVTLAHEPLGSSPASTRF